MNFPPSLIQLRVSAIKHNRIIIIGNNNILSHSLVLYDEIFDTINAFVTWNETSQL